MCKIPNCDHCQYLLTLHSNWVFVNLDSSTSVSLREYLGPLIKITENYNLSTYKYFREATHEVDINWKTYVDNYQEGYHVPVAHPALDKVVDCRHYKVDVWKHPMGGGHAIHSVPTRKGKCLKHTDGDLSSLPDPIFLFNYFRNLCSWLKYVSYRCNRRKLCHFASFGLQGSYLDRSAGCVFQQNFQPKLGLYNELTMTYTRQGGQQWSMGLSLS